MLTNEQIARPRLLSHSSFFPDIIALLGDFRQQAATDLESAIDMPKIYRAQGSISALDLVAMELHRLRTAPPDAADKQIQSEE